MSIRDWPHIKAKISSTRRHLILRQWIPLLFHSCFCDHGLPSKQSKPFLECAALTGITVTSEETLTTGDAHALLLQRLFWALLHISKRLYIILHWVNQKPGDDERRLHVCSCCPNLSSTCEATTCQMFWKQPICALCFIQATLKVKFRFFSWKQQQLYMQLR